MPARFPVNLGSEPFRRDRPMFVASICVGVLQVALLALLISMAISDESQMAETKAELQRLEAESQKVGAEQAALEAVLREPLNAEALEKSLFLNLLLYRKGISWTKIFDDLEKVMPYNVRLVSIRPQVDGENRILLDMTIAAASSESVIDMLRRLEGSDLFGGTAVHNSSPPSQTDPEFKFRISANYLQRL
jgi:Tfp pilus assembly protein PilN